MASIALANDINTFTPGFQDLIDRGTELMKLLLIQEVAAVESPKSVATSGRTAEPILGKMLVERLAANASVKRRASSSPLTDLYDPAMRTLVRRLGIDLMSGKDPFHQIDMPKEFRSLRGELTPERIARSKENLFTVHSVDDPIATRPISHGRIGAGLALVAGDSLEVARSALTPLSVITPSDTVRFRLHQVKAIDETNPEWLGSDEIAIGGVAVNATGSIAKIPERRVGSFDDGDRKKYTPPLVLHEFPISGAPHPQNLAVTVALAEKDGGGFSSFLEKLMGVIQSKIMEILIAVGVSVGSSIGAGVGGVIGTLGGPLGFIIGAVAGAILGAIIGWIISATRDDLFIPQMAGIEIPDPTATFEGGGLVSPVQSLEFRGHGGWYRVWYSWQIVR